MSAMIDPNLRDLQQKQEEMRVALARTQGEVEVIKRNSESNDRQTTRRFVAFSIMMFITAVSCIIGASIFQTAALRREMDAKFENVNQRLGALEKRQEKMEKSIQEIKDLLRQRN